MGFEWIDNLLNGKMKKEAMEAQGKDATDHFEKKVKAHAWVHNVLDLDPVKVDKEYQDNLAAEARLLGKTAAYEMGETMDKTIEKDYQRDVKILSDYALAEMLAELRCSKAQNTNEMFYEEKEKAKKEVASSREKAEKALLDMVPEHTILDWHKAFERFSKDAKPEEPKEKDLFQPVASEAAHIFDKPTEEKFKTPKDQDKAIPGNGREADERTEATKEAGVLQADITEGLGKVASKKKLASTNKEARPCNANDLFLSSAEGGLECTNCGAHGDHSTLKHDPNKNPQLKQKEAHCGSCPGDSGHEQKGPSIKLKHQMAEPFFDEEEREFEKPTEDKFKVPSDEKKADVMIGVGREADERTDVTAEAGVVQESITEGLGKVASVEKKAAVEEVTTTNFADFGSRERGMVRELLNAWDTQGLPEDFFDEGVHPMMNRNSGNVFLTNSEYQVAMMHGGKLESFYSCPECGHEGFKDEMQHEGDAECQRYLKDIGVLAGDSVEPEASKTASPINPIKREELHTEACPVCASQGEDLKNDQMDHYSCQECGITYGDKEIKSCASKADVIKKIAEISSPWVVQTLEDGTEVIARVEQPTNTKESEESKEDELKK